MRYDENMNPIYKCPICKDAGWLYERKPNGMPDYSKVKKCSCKIQQQLPLGENNAT